LGVVEAERVQGAVVLGAGDAVGVGVFGFEEAVWERGQVGEAALEGGVATGLGRLAGASPVFEFLFSETCFNLSLDECSASALPFLQFAARKESSTAVHLEI